MPSPAPAPTPAGRPMPAPSHTQPPAPAARAQAPVIPPLPSPRKPEPPPPPPFARLELLGADGQVYLLCTDMVRVGRLSPADGILPEIDLTAHDSKGTVSRRHAIITREGEQVYLEDSGSINGTHVNGARLASGVQRPLQEGDQVCFGEVAFRYHHVKQGAP